VPGMWSRRSEAKEPQRRVIEALLRDELLR